MLLRFVLKRNNIWFAFGSLIGMAQSSQSSRISLTDAENEYDGRS